MKQENWKPIPGYEELYDVSDWGHIWSYKSKRIVGNYNNVRYNNVSLHKDGIGKSVDIHTLVIKAFIGPCPEGIEICHEDGNRHNNFIKNLRYGTGVDNCTDREKHGRTYRGEKHWKCKLTQEKVEEALARIEAGELLKDVAQECGISKTHMICIRQSKAWKTTDNPITSTDLRKGRSRGSRTLTPGQIDEAYRLLDNEMTQKQVGAIFGISQTPFRRLVLLRKRG